MGAACSRDLAHAAGSRLRSAHDNPRPIDRRDRSYDGIFDICIEGISDSSRVQQERDTIIKKADLAEQQRQVERLRAEQAERERAAERARAEQAERERVAERVRADDLAARLRALGIAPDAGG